MGLLLLVCRTQAQVSFNSGGGDVSGSQAAVSFSIGQVFYESPSSGVTPGVQQPPVLIITSDKTIPVNAVEINLYPNPVTDHLDLLIQSDESLEPLKVKAVLYDLTGNAVANQLITTQLTRIKTSRLKQGVYLLKVTGLDSEIKTFKVVKK